MYWNKLSFHKSIQKRPIIKKKMLFEHTSVVLPTVFKIQRTQTLIPLDSTSHWRTCDNRSYNTIMSYPVQSGQSIFQKRQKWAIESPKNF